MESKGNSWQAWSKSLECCEQKHNGMKSFLKEYSKVHIYWVGYTNLKQSPNLIKRARQIKAWVLNFECYQIFSISQLKNKTNERFFVSVQQLLPSGSIWTLTLSFYKNLPGLSQIILLRFIFVKWQWDSLSAIFIIYRAYKYFVEILVQKEIVQKWFEPIVANEKKIIFHFK